MATMVMTSAYVMVCISWRLHQQWQTDVNGNNVNVLLWPRNVLTSHAVERNRDQYVAARMLNDALMMVTAFWRCHNGRD